MGIAIKIGQKDFSEKKIQKISFVSIKGVERISASFNTDGHEIYETTSLNTLKDYLTVTATYDDGSTEAIKGYELSGTLKEGTSTITVSYSGKTTTFNVTVSHLAVLESISATYTQGQNVVYATTPLDDLKSDLVVTAYNDDGTRSNVIGADYTLSGTLTVGTSTVTVNYSGKTTTFNVVVTAGAKELESISATYTQGKVYPSTSLDSLKTNLVVTATYDDSSTETLSSNDYTLSGTLAEGTSVVTATYQGKTATFNVIVSAEPDLPTEYQEVEYLETSSRGANSVDTGINFVPATDRLVIDFTPTTFAKYGNNAFGSPFGDYWTNTSAGLYMYMTSAAKAYVRCGKSVNITPDDEVLVANQKYNLDIYHDTILLNGVSKGTPDGTYAPAASYSMYLFGSRHNSSGNLVSDTYFVGKIHGCKIYRGDELLLDFVPCYRKSDNKTGMYYKVSKTFKASNGTITAGAAV